MNKTMYSEADQIIFIQQLDLFTEYSLQCESILVNSGIDQDAAILRDCADLNVLLYQFIKRSSVLDKALIKCCIESWALCSITVLKYNKDATFEKCYEICLTCVNDFKKLISN